MLFLLPPLTLLLTEGGGRADSEASDVAPLATEMLSLAICATGDALERHEPLYQLARFVDRDGLVGEPSLTAPFVSTVGALDAVSSPCWGCVFPSDWLLLLVVSVGWSLFGLDLFALGGMFNTLASTAFRFLCNIVNRGLFRLC